MPLTDEQFADRFLESETWRRTSHLEPFKRRRGLTTLVCSFLREWHRVEWRSKTPLEIEMAVGRIEHVIRSRWAKKAAATRKRAGERRKRALAEPTFL